MSSAPSGLPFRGQAKTKYEWSRTALIDHHHRSGRTGPCVAGSHVRHTHTSHTERRHHICSHQHRAAPHLWHAIEGSPTRRCTRHEAGTHTNTQRHDSDHRPGGRVRGRDYKTIGCSIDMDHCGHRHQAHSPNTSIVALCLAQPDVWDNARTLAPPLYQQKSAKIPN